MGKIALVLIGHKNHGKSTLIGRLLWERKSIKESRIKQIKKAMGKKFELAHLVDSFKEGREKEMTMETTSFFLKGNKRNYQLIDVPGHRELIANMLTGTAGAEAALLVVSVTEGIREQTIQHLEIAKLLGIEQLGVVINKMDEIDYQKEKFEEIKEKSKEILNKIGYLLKDTSFFPISAREGDNLIKKSSKTPWYSGVTLLDFLENEIKLPKSLENLPLRFLVQDKYGEIVVGKIESGKMKLNQEILFLPENKKTKIISIKDSEKELKEAKAGQNIGIVLREKFNISRGEVGVELNNLLKVSKVLAGEIFWIEAPSQKNLLCECGTAQVEGKLKEPKFVKEKEKTFYKIYLKKSLAFEPKSKTILGKIVLKDQGKIIGVGNII